MSDAKPTPPRSRGFVNLHDGLDAYWFAQVLRKCALHIAAEADCKSTIGRRLDTALGRAVRHIVEAANGPRDKADARLARALEAIALAMSYFNDLFLDAGVRDVVVAELRERATVLAQRLEMLKREPVGTWSASNCLPTVLEKPKEVEHAEPPADVIVVLTKVKAAAVHGLPDPIVTKADAAVPATWDALAAKLNGAHKGPEGEPPMTS